VCHVNYNSINDGDFSYIGYKSFESREINDWYKYKGAFINNNKENLKSDQSWSSHLNNNMQTFNL